VPMPVGSRLAVGDFDADGFVDFGVCTPTSWQPVRNVAGTFTAVVAANQTLAAFAGDPVEPLVVDLEHDGDLDVLLAPSPWVRARWLRNTGGVPSLLVAPDLAEQPTRGTSLAIGDVDGDAAPDLLLVAWGGPGAWYLGDGHGRFAPAGLGSFTQGSTDLTWVQLADLDDDGDLDVAASGPANGSFPPVVLYWNQGGVFTQQLLPVGGGGQLAAGDLDGDGDVDLYCSPFGSSDVVLINQGAGTFVHAAAAVPANVLTRTPRLAHIDGDGDLDVIGGAAVLRNDGTGVFTLVTTTGAYPGTPPLVGDFDADQDVDFVLGQSLYRNDGTGQFTAAATGLPPLPSAGPRAAAGGRSRRRR
jgi:hypothetical protein